MSFILQLLGVQVSHGWVPWKPSVLCGEELHCLLVGDLEHGFYDFPYASGTITPTDELIFFRGVETTNQRNRWSKMMKWIGIVQPQRSDIIDISWFFAENGSINRVQSKNGVRCDTAVARWRPGCWRSWAHALAPPSTPVRPFHAVPAVPVAMGRGDGVWCCERVKNLKLMKITQLLGPWKIFWTCIELYCWMLLVWADKNL